MTNPHLRAPLTGANAMPGLSDYSNDDLLSGSLQRLREFARRGPTNADQVAPAILVLEKSLARIAQLTTLKRTLENQIQKSDIFEENYPSVDSD